MKQFIKALSAQYYPTLSLIFSMYYALAHGDKIAKIQIVNKDVAALKECFIMNIQWRFDYVENSNFLKAATFLDYRYKNFIQTARQSQTGRSKCPRLQGHIGRFFTFKV